MASHFGKKRMVKRALAAIAWLGLVVLIGLTPHIALGVDMTIDQTPSTADTDETAGTGYMPANDPVLSIHDNDDANANNQRLFAIWLPSSYSSVDQGYVTQPRDQSSFNTCWAFSTLGSLESQVLAQQVLGGYESATTIDLSERHLAYFMFNTQPDPLGNTYGDSTAAVGNLNYLTAGGNDMMAAYALASWMGAAREDAVPTYEELVSSYETWRHGDFDLESGLSHSKNYLHLSGMKRIAMGDMEDVKQTIVSNGAVSSSIYMSDNNYRDMSRVTHAMYVENRESGVSANHAILLVGWDDNYPVKNFKTSPSQPGAWLVRNSWGDGWGNDGYFWVSYEDAYLSTTNCYAFEGAPSENLDNIYQYDGTSSQFYNYVESGGSIANVYTAAANPSGIEQLTTVGFFLTGVNVHYSVQIYTNVQDENDPTSGQAELGSPLDGTTSFAGYYTVDLPNPVELAQGERFSVVITVESENGDMVSYDVDRSASYRWVRHVNKVAAGQSFERDFPDAAWEDLSSSSLHYPDYQCDSDDETQCSARIKAFTNNIEDGSASAPRVTYRISVLPEGSGTVSTTQSTAQVKTQFVGLVELGASDVLTATPLRGFEFSHWEDAQGRELSAENPLTLTVEGPTSITAVFSEMDPVPVYRMYNKRTSEHLYTCSKAEYGSCGKGAYVDWRTEGVAWYAPAGSLTPVYRLYNTVSGDHHYTTSLGERRSLVQQGDWREEGIAFYSDDSQRVPLFRLYNGRLWRGQHHYTANVNEHDVLISNYGWTGEGVGFFGASR